MRYIDEVRRCRVALLLLLLSAAAVTADEDLAGNWGALFDDILDRANQLQDCGILVPHTCESRGFDCGVTDDGCGTAVDCGACPSHHEHVCEARVCRCVPSHPQLTSPIQA